MVLKIDLSNDYDKAHYLYLIQVDIGCHPFVHLAQNNCFPVWQFSKSGLVVSEQSALLLFLHACPRRGRDIESWVLNWFNLRKAALGESNHLPWWRKREMMEQEIPSRCCSRKPSHDRGMRWWIISPKSFDGCR